MPRVGAVIGLLCVPALLVAQGANKPNSGIAPRSAPGEYPAQTVAAGVTYAAALIPPPQVKRLFAFDISKDYVVFEIGIYPGSSNTNDLTADKFTLMPSKAGEPVRPSDPTTVAAAIQQKNLPKHIGSASDTTIVTGAEVGYESGRDPYTGRPVHGTYTSAGVGVEKGEPGPPRMPSPGGYPQDRELLENQLWDKMLPEGHFDRPVAGYLYFPASLLKRRSNGAYELEYLGSEKVKLSIPAK